MLLAIDIGNTHVVLGLYRDQDLLGHWRMQSDAKRTEDEYAMQVLNLLGRFGHAPEAIDTVIISCVVPALGGVFDRLAQKYFSVRPLVVGPGLKTRMEIAFDDPRAVGADRVVNAVAARELYGAPVLVVDFGTATTFDVINSSGVYEGGVIAPGVMIAAQALFEKAALLPNIELGRPSRVIGKNTRESMLSGVFLGYVCLVDGLIERIRSELGYSAKVVATGGLAKSVAQESKYIEEVAPELTLTGLQLIASFNG
ncbi:MAG: type III pantothenate kinase [Bdellovibrionales bacterium]|nr:type III pantothenate kinase [Bdellovibrionales bacterium]